MGRTAPYTALVTRSVGLCAAPTGLKVGAYCEAGLILSVADMDAVLDCRAQYGGWLFWSSTRRHAAGKKRGQGDEECDQRSHVHLREIILVDQGYATPMTKHRRFSLDGENYCCVITYFRGTPSWKWQEMLYMAACIGLNFTGSKSVRFRESSEGLRCENERTVKRSPTAFSC